jgi:MoxR-like ATPase
MSDDVAAIKRLVKKHAELKKEISKVIIGQEKVIDQILISVFSGGHALLIGVPGLAKTLMVNTISQALGLDFKRIQFTPDLMPSDILGSEILDETRHFKFIKGPIFSNIILADEINRTPPKTQAALLEAMQERSVTVAGHHYTLDLPYFVLATQNPIEQEGTYPLPEAQMDRFLMHISIDYPSDADEKEVMRLVRGESSSQSSKPEKVSVPQEAVFEARAEIDQIGINEAMEDYIVALVAATRRPAELDEDLGHYIQVGVSPRGTIALDKASRAHAWLEGRSAVTPDDIRAVLGDCLRHRIGLSYEAQADGITCDDVIGKIVKLVAVA